MSCDLAKRVELLEKQIALLLNTEAEPKKVKKPKVKRISGYIVFSNATRDEVKTKLAIGEEKPKNTDVMKELAIMWKALTVAERYNWNNKAEQVREADCGR